MADDFVPETLAAADAINRWIAEQEDLAPGTKVRRGIGFGKFDLRGTAISALAQPYRFWLLERAQADYAAMNAPERKAFDGILGESGMAPVIGARLTRKIGRKDNLEIWL